MKCQCGFTYSTKSQLREHGEAWDSSRLLKEGKFRLVHDGEMLTGKKMNEILEFLKAH